MTKSPAKKTIYVDVDEEITGIIDKVRSVDESIIALVLPKRATVMHSIVNMKLLKRAADQTDKKVVLITSESTLMPLAGAVGIYVAPNLQTRPYLPPTPDEANSTPQANEEPEEVEIDPSTPIGEAAKLPAETEEKPIEIDNSPKEEEVGAAAGAVATATAKASSKKAKGKDKPKVPNFNRFRKLLIIGSALLLLLLLGVYWAFFLAPKATVALRGETADVPLTLDVVGDTEAEESNLDEGIVQASLIETKKSDTEKVAATGQKDKGNKASGTMTLRNCSQKDGNVTIPAGTGMSAGDITFISQQAVTLDPSVFSGGGNCLSGTKQVPVIAQNPGDRYNVSSRSYTVAGFAGVNATGSDMSGGTSQIVKVVSASDVESAKQKIASRQSSAADEVKRELKNQGYVAVPETLATKSQNVSPSPAVDSEANEVTVTVETVYTMLGLKEDDLKKLIESEAKKEVDEKQAILSDGLSDAVFRVGSKRGSKTNISIVTRVVAGPEINQDEIKQDIAGKKSGEAESILRSRPGIKEARVELKPFWVKSVPKKAEKVELVIEEADGTEITP